MREKKIPPISGARFGHRPVPGSGAIDVFVRYTIGRRVEEQNLARCRNAKVAAVLVDGLRMDAEGLTTTLERALAPLMLDPAGLDDDQKAILRRAFRDALEALGPAKIRIVCSGCGGPWSEGHSCADEFAAGDLAADAAREDEAFGR